MGLSQRVLLGGTRTPPQQPSPPTVHPPAPSESDAHFESKPLAPISSSLPPAPSPARDEGSTLPATPSACDAAVVHGPRPPAWAPAGTDPAFPTGQRTLDWPSTDLHSLAKIPRTKARTHGQNAVMGQTPCGRRGSPRTESATASTG